jgi:hypothetical protein
VIVRTVVVRADRIVTSSADQSEYFSSPEQYY